MTARLSARKLTTEGGYVCRPILTKTDLARAVKELERRFGKGLTVVDADAMSAREREYVARSLIRIAEARCRFGVEPFYPFDESEYHLLMPFPYLSDAEILLLSAFIDATGNEHKWPVDDSIDEE